MKKILLLDGYNLMYRARYSGMNKGEYSTIFNFFRGLRPLIEKFSPDQCFFVLEGKPLKRLEVDPEYKGQREYHNRDNFNEQRKTIINILQEYFPIDIVRHKNYECDDVIGYLAEQNKENEVTIVSSDTDFIQCITDKIKLYNPVKKKFIEKPEYDYVLWKSLKGDASDNIIGFKGIGDKRAKKLCESKEELEKFLEVDGRNKKLKNNLFMIRLHDLTNEKQNLEYYEKIKEKKWDSLKNVFKEFKFSSIISKDSTWEKYKKTFECLFNEE